MYFGAWALSSCGEESGWEEAAYPNVSDTRSLASSPRPLAIVAALLDRNFAEGTA
jgi:hypothetical protein